MVTKAEIGEAYSTRGADGKMVVGMKLILSAYL
jgi:hypothetical protein